MPAPVALLHLALALLGAVDGHVLDRATAMAERLASLARVLRRLTSVLNGAELLVLFGLLGAALSLLVALVRRVLRVAWRLLEWALLSAAVVSIAALVVFVGHVAWEVLAVIPALQADVVAALLALVVVTGVVASRWAMPPRCSPAGRSRPQRARQQRLPVGARVRFEVLERNGFACSYCHRTDVPLEVDHIEPVARGGTSDPSNLTAACRRCNQGKADKLLTMTPVLARTGSARKGGRA